MRFCTIPTARFSKAVANPFVSNEEMDIILTLASRYNNPRVLEIGTNKGITTANIARVLKARSEGRVFSVDVSGVPSGLPDSQKTEVLPREEIGSEIPDDLRGMVDLGLVRPDQDGDLEGLLLHWSKGGKFDLVFLDGDHSYKGVSEAYEAVLHFLSPWGIVLFHDVWFDEEPPPVDGPMFFLNERDGCVINFSHIGVTGADEMRL